eukprot:m.16356 g.16356  ORF g.16356 m.16356 type:complete len:75 (-) comp8063_c0_seq2:929-1153(-)
MRHGSSTYVQLSEQLVVKVLTEEARAKQGKERGNKCATGNSKASLKLVMTVEGDILEVCIAANSSSSEDDGHQK